MVIEEMKILNRKVIKGNTREIQKRGNEKYGR